MSRDEGGGASSSAGSATIDAMNTLIATQECDLNLQEWEEARKTTAEAIRDNDLHEFYPGARRGDDVSDATMIDYWNYLNDEIYHDSWGRVPHGGAVTLDEFTDQLTAVLLAPGRTVRSPEEMSRMAPFTDGGRTIDRTNWFNSYISYYPFGGVTALALDLSLRERSNGKTTLDDFMRAMWRTHGKPAPPRPGYVAQPYTIDDAERRLAEVSGDAAFAHQFFERHIHGREQPDFSALLAPAGLVIRKLYPGRAWWGDARLETRTGLLIADTPRSDSPIYLAGLDLGDEIRSLDGTRVSQTDDVTSAARRHKPGDKISVEYVDRGGTTKTATLTLAEDPRVEVVPVESTGRNATPAQLAFRNAWLGKKGQ